VTEHLEQSGYLRRFIVGRQGDSIIVQLLMPEGDHPAGGAKLTRAEAVTLAAWLVAIADPSGESFELILEAVRNT